MHLLQAHLWVPRWGRPCPEGVSAGQGSPGVPPAWPEPVRLWKGGAAPRGAGWAGAWGVRGSLQQVSAFRAALAPPADMVESLLLHACSKWVCPCESQPRGTRGVCRVPGAPPTPSARMLGGRAPSAPCDLEELLSLRSWLAHAGCGLSGQEAVSNPRPQATDVTPKALVDFSNLSCVKRAGAFPFSLLLT